MSHVLRQAAVLLYACLEALLLGKKTAHGQRLVHDAVVCCGFQTTLLLSGSVAGDVRRPVEGYPPLCQGTPQRHVWGGVTQHLGCLHATQVRCCLNTLHM